MVAGRPRKYHTDEERAAAKRASARKKLKPGVDERRANERMDEEDMQHRRAMSRLPY